ncbi:MAG TPA: hypothetical protein VF747_09410, partial [Blastocatellia bacterium]
GKKFNIKWTATAGISKVDVKISRDGGTTWAPLAEDLDATLGTIRVKAKKPKSDSVIVQVVDSANPEVWGQSGVFRIR